MDAETLRAALIVLQEELANLRANQENVVGTMVLQQREIDRQRQELNDQQANIDRRQRDDTAALVTAIQLARGQLAPASQPNQPTSTHPQQNPHSELPQHQHNPPQPMHPQRQEQPLAAQQERPFQNPEQQPTSRAGRENTQQQRQNRAGQHPRSPRCQTVEEQNPPSSGQRPSGGRRQVESGSVIRGPP
ncbi:transcriptional activator ptaB-like [Humulus lupulus]|uniref:transcriptional activator ptaB-like n=1 Tax=Humulus lupulus TaxID=3486 RepID=UPI002B417B6D|nr:transcriptional activator ptaB-like [Humulus lupulus]